MRARVSRRLAVGALMIGLFAIQAGQAVAAPTFNGVGIEARLIKVDTTSESATVRIEPVPLGSFRVGPTAPILTRDVVLYTGTLNGELAHSYRAGGFMDPFEATVPLDGDTSTYPFHHLNVEIAALASTGGGVAAGKQIQVRLHFTSRIAGYRISPSSAVRQGESVNLYLRVDPSWPTVAFVVFIMVVMWALALGAVAVAVNLVTRRRRFEGSFATLLAALLFAFPTVRNTLPGIPPVGVLFDYAAFFWAEALVALSLISLIVGWTARRLVGTVESQD
jgi:hypothetical protein